MTQNSIENKSLSLSVYNAHVRQRTRIVALRICGMLFLLCVLFFQPAFGETNFGTMLSIFGSALVVISVVGRCWAIFHIGSRKNVNLVQTGPYSYCRNPLYFFSFLATLGCGLVSKSIILSIVFSLVVLFLFVKLIQKEEQYLLQKFGHEYRVYRLSVPRFFPMMRKRVEFSLSPIDRNYCRHIRQFVETFSILFLIPIILIIEKVRDFLQLKYLVLI